MYLVYIYMCISLPQIRPLRVIYIHTEIPSTLYFLSCAYVLNKEEVTTTDLPQLTKVGSMSSSNKNINSFTTLRYTHYWNRTLISKRKIKRLNVKFLS